MNADDVFRYGHLTVLGAVDAFPNVHWETSGVCGVWSAKDVIAHLASYELATADAFAGILGEEPSETLGLLLSRGEAFNDSQVEQRRAQTVEETLAEYTQAHECAAEMLTRIPLEQRRQPGILSWYGAEYDLEDLITYMSYGHKREHSAQIAEFCCRLSPPSET
jgi:Mycothiol maleylpyruvate isomerase N-terminal domain